MLRIFISYRREDSDIWAGRLADELRKHFSAEQVFQDIASIDPGADFRTVLDEALATAAVMLVVIGPRWLSATDRSGRKRLESPADLVHQEVAESLRSREARVFPLLVNGAEMPAEEDLPDPLKPLARRNAVELTVRHWASDVAQLVQILKRAPGLAETRLAGEEIAPHGAEHEAQRREVQERAAKAEAQRRTEEEQPKKKADGKARLKSEEAAQIRRRGEEETPEVRLYPASPSTSQGSPQRGSKWGAPLIALAALLVLGGGWMAFNRSQENERQLTAQAAAEQWAAAEKTAAEQTAAQNAAAERAAIEQAKVVADKVGAEQAAAKKAAAERASYERAEAARKAVAEKSATRRASAETADADRLNTPPPQSSRDKAVVQLNVSGRWHDNWGTVYTITQDGNAMKFAAEGTSCRGGYFRSVGRGTVTGNSFETTYQSTLPSRGECSGTISASGTRMTSTCKDTACGQFASSVDRQ